MMHQGAETGSVAGPSTSRKNDTPCRYFYRSGECKRGDKCQFSHQHKHQPGEPGTIPRSAITKETNTRLSAQANEFTPGSSTPSKLSALARTFEPIASTDDDDWEDVDLWRSTNVNVPIQLPPTAPIDLGMRVGENTEPCGICMEIPEVYAQHPNCDHLFCPPCLLQWRKQRGQDNSKKCPTCRSSSKYTFVTPQPFIGSARVLAHKRFRERAASTPCKAFTKSLNLSNKRKKPFCPFGDDCLYQHHIDGKPHKFEVGRYRIHTGRKGTRRLMRPAPSTNVRPASTIQADFFERITVLDESIRNLIASRNMPSALGSIHYV